MEGRQIIEELRALGHSPVRVANSLGVQVQVVSDVIYGRGKSYRTAALISLILGKPVSELWPGAYDYKPLLRQGQKGRPLPNPKVAA